MSEKRERGKEIRGSGERKEWCTVVEGGEAVLTFLVKIFCTAKVKVANRALRRPTMSKDNSVAVAIMTPPTMGIKEQ